MKSCNSCISADKRMDEYPCVECHGYSEYEEMVEVKVEMEPKKLSRIEYANYVYDIVLFDCEDMDSIYKDYIERLVGVHGFNALHDFNLIESCGVINGRQLYVLVDKKTE